MEFLGPKRVQTFFYTGTCSYVKSRRDTIAYAGNGGVFVLHKSPLRKYAPRPLSRTSNNWKRWTKNGRSIGPFLFPNERTNERTDESKKTQTGRKLAIIRYFVLVDSPRWFLSGCPFTLCRTIIRPLVYYCVINCN